MNNSGLFSPTMNAFPGCASPPPAKKPPKILAMPPKKPPMPLRKPPLLLPGVVLPVVVAPPPNKLASPPSGRLSSPLEPNAPAPAICTKSAFDAVELLLRNGLLVQQVFPMFKLFVVVGVYRSRSGFPLRFEVPNLLQTCAESLLHQIRCVLQKIWFAKVRCAFQWVLGGLWPEECLSALGCVRWCNLQQRFDD